MKKLLILLLISLFLTSCAMEPAVAVGVGRTEAPTNGQSTPATDSSESEDGTVGTDSGESEPEGEDVPVTEGFASYSGSEAEGNLKYVTHKGKVLSDFSFLDGLSKNFFSDTDPSDKQGTWYCGKTVRDLETGEVTLVFDRAADVLDAIEKYGAVYRKNEDKKVVYITFDCGFENGYTDDILDILKEKDVKASFFLNGQFIKTSADLVKRMLDEGHIVGNHGNNHRVMSKLTIEELFYEVESNNALLQEAVPGAPYMKYFRPPSGSCSAWDMALYQAMDLESVLYSWAYYDYAVDAQPEPAKALEQMKTGLHNGSVIMLHTVGETNVEVLGDFIDYIRAEGFEIRNIDE